MKEQVEFFDTDFLGNKIGIGDKVIFEAPKYRDFVIGTVVTKAPKSCQIEYINDWNYSEGHKEIVRQYYGQIIKYPYKRGKWVHGDSGSILCSVCGTECLYIDNAKDKAYYDPEQCESNYCPNCGVKMEG